MGQISRFLRRGQTWHTHWCEGCAEAHGIPDSWKFDGNVNCPTFSPSVIVTSVQTVKVEGKWTGEWVLDAKGEPIPSRCHYILTAGIVNFCGDCTHALSGRSVPLLPLPPFLCDD